MKAAGAGLGDPAATEWEEGFTDELHFMLLLAHANPAALQEAIDDTQQEISAFGFITALEQGKALFNEAGAGIEHFGYVDGVSQPLFFEEEWKDSKPKMAYYLLVT